MHRPIKKAIFPVGGLGTRFLPATKVMPKEMLPVASKPLVQHAYEEAVAAGIEQVIFITGRNKNAISDHFDYSYELESVLSEREKQEALELSKGWLPPAGHLAFVRQREPLGLGHAVWCARHFIGNEPFAVLLADELFLSPDGPGVLKQMVDVYQQCGGNIVATAEVPLEQSSRYGMIDLEEQRSDGIIKIKGMVEKPKPEDAPSRWSITGRYILQPEIFSYLSEQKKGSGGEIQLTDAMAAMLATHPFYGVPYSGDRFDCGNRIGFLEANIAFALAHPEMKHHVESILSKFSKELRLAS